MGFSVTVVLMLITVVVSLSRLSMIQGNMERIMTVNNVRGDLANDAAQKVREISSDIREILLAKEDKQREGIKKEIAEDREKYSEQLKKVEEIATASEEQSHGITQVNTAVAEMDKVTQSTAANAEESAAAGGQSRPGGNESCPARPGDSAGGRGVQRFLNERTDPPGTNRTFTQLDACLKNVFPGGTDNEQGEQSDK